MTFSFGMPEADGSPKSSTPDKEAQSRAAEEADKAAEKEARRAAAEADKAAEKEARRAAAEARKAEKEEARRAAAEARRASAEAKKAEREARKAKREEARRTAGEEAAKAAETKASAAPEETAQKRPRIPSRTAAIVIAIVLAAGIGAAAVHFSGSGSQKDKGKTADYTLTLEDYINTNDAARDQIVQSTEGTDVTISVSDNTLIYTYDLSTSNSMTPELAESDEMKEALGETLDASDDKFIELCAGLEKDTGISGVSVRVDYVYGDEVLVSRTYTSEGTE